MESILNGDLSESQERKLLFILKRTRKFRTLKKVSKKLDELYGIR